LASRNKTEVGAEVLIHLAIYFGVSFEAIGWRMLSLRKLSASKWEELRNEKIPSSPTARILGYTAEEGTPERFPRHYKYLAHEAYKRKLISFERLAELLGRNYYELREEFARGSKEGDV
jgi:Zn-dependent peptidase ImmA (M78 family)